MVAVGEPPATFCFKRSKVTESFRAIYNLEEELMAMFRPSPDESKRAKQEEEVRISRERKDEARARILGKLIVCGEAYGSMEEIRTQLELDDIGRNLFSNSCWVLSWGDPEKGIEPRITMRRVGVKDRTRSVDRRPFIIKPILG
jgi:hypothetical protein